MERNFLQFEQSEWWILLLVAASLALTWLLYSISKKPWTKIQNRILSSIRFVGIFLLLLLLLEPLINQVISRSEAPIVSIAVDNSESVVARGMDSTVFRQQLDDLVDELEGEGVEVLMRSFGDPGALQFDYPTTNLSELMTGIESEMEGRNWVGSILMSDGIFNSGSSPIYRPFMVPQFTVGLGDTIPPKDINISRVLYNKVTFKGNETPIRVEISQQGFGNREVTLNLMESGQVIRQRQLILDQEIKEEEFTITSDEEGLRRLSVQIDLQNDEFVTENNSQDIFMEVIDGQVKILVVAQAPHPDVKAIRSVLSSTDNYKVDHYIPSLSTSAPTDIYDVVIYHGAFAGRTNYNPKGDPGIWYILNDKSSLNAMNNSLSFFSIQKRGLQPDNITPTFNQSFTKFKIPDNQSVFEALPPIEVPFGDYSVSGPTEVLLYQRVGSISTSKPLLTFFDDGSQKKAILAGQNIWKWKLQESAINGNSEQFHDLITKTIQFLSVKNDKKQFRFRSRGNTFSNLESIVFDSEVYNDIYERTYGNRISLRVTHENGESTDFEFVDSELNSSFRVPTLSSGLYTYSASTVVGDKTYRDSGRFLVEEINKEYLNLTADHNTLKTLASVSDGEYVHYSEMNDLKGILDERSFKSLIRSSENFLPLIDSRWVLLMLLLLFSSEWFLRKYWGGY